MQNNITYQTKDSNFLPAINSLERNIVPGSAGLVLSLTSDTLNIKQSHSDINKSGEILIDNKKLRKSRLKRSVLNAANYLENQLNKDVVLRTDKYRCLMLTLTYAPEFDYDQLHITSLLKCIRSYLSRKSLKFHYVWVLENTKRGRPHYHILIWLPAGLSLPKPDKRGWWQYGLTKIEWIRKNGAAYIAKYCAKHDESQGDFPKGARLHGCGGLSVINRLKRSWWNLSHYVRDYFPDPELNIRSAKGGGFVSKVTGEILESRYEIKFSPLRVVLKESYLT